MTDLNVRIAGAAGQGMLSAGKFLGKACVRAGYHVFGLQDLMSRIRGGHNYFQLRISDKPVSAVRTGIHILITLNAEGSDEDFKQLNAGGVALLDSETIKIKPGDSRVHDVPLRRIAKETGGKPLFSNSVALGYVCGILGLELWQRI